MSALRKADGHQALIRLTLALANAEGEDAELIVDGLIELADRTEEYLRRFDTPDSAALKCEAAIQTPPAVPQRAADSGARDEPSVARAAPSQPARAP